MTDPRDPPQSLKPAAIWSAAGRSGCCEVASHCMVTDGPKDLQGLIFGCDRELFDRYFKILLDTSSFFSQKSNVVPAYLAQSVCVYLSLLGIW